MGETPLHHVYLIPGLFGFARLAGYDYFVHLEEALAERFEQAGLALRQEVIPTPPTTSIVHRAQVVARAVASSHDGHGPIHLLGHSTGGLDTRLLLSPVAQLPLPAQELAWRRHVVSAVSLSCPHHGTPLAGYFTSVAGTRLLYALSLLTVASLTRGRLPLTAFSGLVALVGKVDDALGLDIHLLDQLTDRMLAIIGEDGRGEIHRYLEHVRDNRGGIIQLMPEVMELFNAAVPDHHEVRYGCVATAAPPPGPRRVLRAVVSPLSALGLAVYATVYGIASRVDVAYPYAVPNSQQRGILELGFGRLPTPSMVDGIVPTLSMLWGELLWCGDADHLDAVGHFHEPRTSRPHVDWLASGAHFKRREFQSMVDAIARFMLRA